MTESVVRVSGRDGLGVVARLLQHSRLEHPTDGVWEAADLYWWWRSPRRSDSLDQHVWLDDSGEPIAACVFTEWRNSWGYDPIVLPSRKEDMLPSVMAAAVHRIDAGEVGDDVAMAVPDTDEHWRELAVQHGFRASTEQHAVLWMDAGNIPAISEPPVGYTLSDRLVRAELPHHFDLKFGGNEQARLAASQLYRRDLDLCIVDDEGYVAAYGLFWFDPVTRVGMVEPMRTEDAHQGRGLGRTILTAGLARLMNAGAARLKISVEVGNAPAEHLYTSVGFVPTRIDTSFEREAR